MVTTTEPENVDDELARHSVEAFGKIIRYAACMQAGLFGLGEFHTSLMDKHVRGLCALEPKGPVRNPPGHPFAGQLLVAGSRPDTVD